MAGGARAPASELFRPGGGAAKAGSAPRRWPILISATLAAASCGLWVGALTLRLNPQVPPRSLDAALLFAELAVLYGLGGLLLGGFGAAGSALLGLIRPSWASGAARLMAWGLGCGPILFGLLLPDTGLSRGLLTRLLFQRAPLFLIGGVLTSLVLVCVVAWVGERALAAIRRGWGIPSAVTLLAAWGLAVGGIAALAMTTGSQRTVAERPPVVTLPTEDDDPLPSDDVSEPPPVVLLCIDGADPDDVVWPMAQAGELPAFARLMNEGVWGELATFYPTLSPSVWTTLATGRSPQDHGIHQFTYFRLPGLRRVIHEFPVHSGLNFRIFPLLESLPGVPRLRGPYTSTLRQTKALWNIVGERYPVGVFAWRVTWPAEEVNGFTFTTGVSLLEAEAGYDESELRRNPRLVFPQDALEGIELPNREPADTESLRRSIAADESIEPGDRRLPTLARHLDPRAMERLWALIEKYRPRFVAAGFYSVDGLHHLFSRNLASGSAFAGAIAEGYRGADRRLGELLERLGDGVNVIVVSDHGYDFRGHQHTHAPAGIFLASGPAFRRGARVDGLSVYDVAPLVLHLLDFPVAEDMPASESLGFLETLTDPQAVRRVATYETGIRDTVPVEPPNWKETEERLKSLGYLND